MIRKRPRRTPRTKGRLLGRVERRRRTAVKVPGARLYALLSAVNDAVLKARSVEELYQATCDGTAREGNFITVAVALCDPATELATIVAAAGPAARAIRSQRLSLSAEFFGDHGGNNAHAREFSLNKSLLNRDTSIHRQAVSPALLYAAGACAPMTLHGDVKGALLFFSNSERTFNKEMLQGLMRAANMLAFAVESFVRDAGREQAEQALRGSEERHRAVLGNMYDAYFEVDLLGNYTFVNDATCRILGYERDELIGMNYRVYVDPESAKRIQQIFYTVYRTGEPAQYSDINFTRKNGNKGICESTVQLMVDAYGKPTGFRGVSRDITKRQQTEDALRASEEKYRGILESVEDAYWEIDLEGNLVFFNSALCRMHGRSESELMGLNYRAYQSPESAEQSYKTFNEVYRTGVPNLMSTVEVIRKDGRKVLSEGSVYLIRNAQGEPVGFRGMIRDVTQHKRDEQLLALEHDVTRTLAEVHSTRKILQSVLRIICESEQWQSGSFWIFDEATQLFRLEVGWIGPGASATAANYYRKNAPIMTIPTNGFMGEVWRTGRPLWIADVKPDMLTVWPDRAALTNEPSIFLFPAMADGKMQGIFGFASKHVREPDTRLLRTASVIGNQVGQFIQRRQAEQILRESEARFRSLTGLSSDWYWEQDKEFRFVRLESQRSDTEAARRLLLGKCGWETGFEIDMEGGWQAHRAAAQAHEIFRDVVMYRDLPDGTRRYIAVSGEPIYDAQGEFTGYRGVSREITGQKLAEERIQYLATHDALTELPNRVMFSQLLNMAISSARRYNRDFAVLFIDLDRFKVINDTLGHEAGDHLLQEIAGRLKEIPRMSDVIARLGGDEFVVLIQEAGEPSQIAGIARKILSTIVKPVTLAGQECRVTASIGISMFPRDANDEQSLMKNADMAMYLAKEDGKNNFQFYSPQTRTPSLERLALETSLRRALERDEFSLHYQAKLDLRTGAITGVEALLRWQSPEHGAVSPAHFIPLAEETGLIVPIGLWVFKTACAQNVAWQRAGLPPICLAVNLSARQLADGNLLNDITEVLSDTGMPPSLFELEITEGMVMHNPERMNDLLTALKDIGVRLAIDDFGTGYSSLAQIKRFPIDTLKVDRSFIRDIPQDAEDKAITEAIIAMAKTLSLTVVAEGVETQEQAEFLRRHACDQMQGYYFSKPIPADDFAKLLQAHPAASLPN